jgi:alpha-amylase
VRVTKRIVIGGDRRSPSLRLEVTVENRSAIQIDARLGLEWTLTMLGGGANPAAWIELDGSRDSHDSRGTASGVTAIAQGNDSIGISVGSTPTEPADVWWAPVDTISNSEAGFERVYQGPASSFSWPSRSRPAHRERSA